MSGESFQAGDLVVLKSGGPDMTVEQKWDEEPLSYRCFWFEGSTPKHAVFVASMLKRCS